MTSIPVQLIDILRLLDGRLPEATAGELRARIEAEPALRERLRQLLSLRDAEAASRDDRLAADTLQGIEEIARLLDAADTDSKLAALEEWCMQDLLRVRELQAVDRSLASESSDTPVTEAIQSVWMNVVDRECASQPSEPKRAAPASQHSSECRCARRRQTAKPAPRIQRRRPDKRRPPSRKIYRQLGGVIAICVLTTMTGVWWMRSGDREGELATIDGQQPPPRPVVPIDEPGTQPNVSPQPELAHVPEPIPTPPPQPVSPQPSPPPSPTREPPDPPAIVAAAKPVLEWKSIVGLVAELDSSEAVWRGVQSKSLAAVTDSPRRFRALAESWGEATTPNGLRIVLTDSADATVQLGGGTDAPMQITLVQGNLSVGGLQPEESLALRVGNWELELQAAAEETEIAVEASEERPQLFVKTGSVRLGDQTVTAPSRVTSGRRGDLFIASARRLPDWASEPGQIDRTRLALLEPLVSEPDLVTALVGENSESATAASRDRSLLALAIDPARALPQMAESPDATTRTTAVEWLLNAPVDEPQADVAWRSLQPSLATTNLRVHAWIAAVQRGSAANRLELYQELATGIGPGEPLFVRQTAIHLLRGLTGQRFANYDPATPSSSAVRDVRLKVRQHVTRRNLQRTPPTRSRRSP